MKKGDKVRMRKGLRVGRKYGSITLSKYMRFKGVVEVPEPLNCDYCEINGWFYSPEMLELVTPDPS